MAKSKKKEEYEKVLNEIFGTDIKWSKLSMHDLKQLVVVLTKHPETLCENICSGYSSKSALTKLIDEIIPPEHQGPLIKSFKVLLKGISKAGSKETGETQ